MQQLWIAKVTVALLKQGKVLSQCSFVVWLIFLLFFVLYKISLLSFLFLFGFILSGIIERYYAFRISFDAELFKELGRQQSVEENLDYMDKGLKDLGLKKAVDVRSITERAIAAKSLLVKQTLVTIFQIVMLAGFILVIGIYNI